MSRITVFFVVFVLFLNFSYVQSVDKFSQPGSSKGSKFQQHNQEESEEVKRANHQQDLQRILKYIEQNRRDEDEFRKREPPIQDQLIKQQRINDRINIDKLELKVREQIEHLLDTCSRRLPLNDAYKQQLFVFNKDLVELKALIYRTAEWRVKETRINDLRQIDFIQQQLNSCSELERDMYIVENILQDPITKGRRVTEQKALEDVDKLLHDNLQRLLNWHSTNQPLNDVYHQIASTIKQNFDGFTLITKHIDQRRMQERLAEGQQIVDIKKNLDLQWQFELEQRKQERPANNKMLAAQRIKDELEVNNLYRAVRQRLTSMEKILEPNIILNKDYAYQKEIFNHDLKKFYMHVAGVQQRRTQEQYVQEIQTGNGSNY